MHKTLYKTHVLAHFQKLVDVLENAHLAKTQHLIGGKNVKRSETITDGFINYHLLC